jgi:ubiquinone/menaquinone biosynthesis C-methylase UbiE
LRTIVYIRDPAGNLIEIASYPRTEVMTMTAESDVQRGRRHRQRVLFDEVADLYAATRSGYPSEIVDFAIRTAGLEHGSVVLEVGCGTGQLTASLAGRGFELTALDIGPSLVAAARRALGAAAVTFVASSFEDFAAPDASIDLIVCATAFHWIDPEVRFSKAARLLRPGGWLALMGTEERYDDPLGAALLQLWITRSEDSGAWARQPRLTDADSINGSGLFEPAIVQTHQRRTTMRASAVVGIENTRATALSWPTEAREEFTAQLRELLAGWAEVQLTQRTSLTMARCLGARARTEPDR